ncbi:MAG: hypothetical protein RR315_02515, partial [Oscillospiraceae bacterium]
PDKFLNLNNQLALKKKHLKWVLCLKNFAKKEKIEFDFVIIKANQFNSGFGKLALENIQIEFPALKKPCNFKKVTNPLSTIKSERNKFYYLFFKGAKKSKNIKVKRLAKSLGDLARKEA